MIVVIFLVFSNLQVAISIVLSVSSAATSGVLSSIGLVWRVSYMPRKPCGERSCIEHGVFTEWQTTRLELL